MYHAILIPGGGVTDTGDLYPWVAARFDTALLHDTETTYYLPLSKGTVYKNSPHIESEMGKHYLINHGISPERILAETTSLDTIGNAYFARTQFTDTRKLAHLLVITSEFHLPRTQAIFDWIFNLIPLPFPYQLTYESASDSTMPAIIKQARINKENDSLNALNQLIPTLTTLDTFRHWLFTKHTAYSPNRSASPAIDADVIKTY